MSTIGLVLLTAGALAIVVMREEAIRGSENAFGSEMRQTSLGTERLRQLITMRRSFVREPDLTWVRDGEWERIVPSPDIYSIPIFYSDGDEIEKYWFIVKFKPYSADYETTKTISDEELMR